ncbi:transporter substrate-binding domain-containing protein [Hahella sp. CR1]|uniref:substrate-binding periplasmic protein n=1 Tax=Hahella sp. CR1 TaxID=2992807 RepID=UPI0024418327|nr:transporter substrate-binding domain-containing protein [Hahella sp. CR1]MDG9666160.1 transporter substrate-binding domain-containing protein [Hahella sp. CR1]
MRLIISVITFISLSLAGYARSEQLIFNSAEFSPFVYEENGKMGGPVTDVILLTCKKINVECSIKQESFSKSEEQVKAGVVNGVYLVSWSESRAEWMYYTLPVLRTSWGFFVPATDKKDYLTLSSFSGQRVGVFGPSSSSKTLDRINPVVNMDIQLSKDDLGNLKKLIQGQLDSVYINRDVGLDLMRQSGLADKVRFAWTHTERNYHIGFSKKTGRKLVNQFNKALRKTYESGEARDILAQRGLESVM